MSNILPFPRAGRRSGGNEAEKAPLSAMEAEILLYTGVRYERHADAPQNAVSASHGRDGDPKRPGRKSRRRA